GMAAAEWHPVPGRWSFHPVGAGGGQDTPCWRPESAAASLMLRRGGAHFFSPKRPAPAGTLEQFSVALHPSMSARQGCRSHQALVDRPRALAALADGPDDQRLAAPHVARGKQVGYAGLVVLHAG